MKAATFSVVVTHLDADTAGEVAEAFGKLAVIVGDAFTRDTGHRGGASAGVVLPYRHGVDGGPIVGYRFNVTVRAPDDTTALELAQTLKLRLADAGQEDGRDCNFTFGGALLSLVDVPDEIEERRLSAGTN